MGKNDMKQTYQAPFIELVPYADKLMEHTAVSGWTPGGGQTGGGEISTGDGERDLSKDFNFEDGFNFNFNFDRKIDWD